MYAITAFETLDLDLLSTEERIQASADARAYLAEYALWGLDVPEYLPHAHRALAAFLTDTKREQEVTAVDVAKKRARDRLPGAARRALIHEEIAALQEELRQV